MLLGHNMCFYKVCQLFVHKHLVIVFCINVIAHVLKRFQKATPPTVKAAMAQKCNDERNATESMKLKAEKNYDN